MDRHSVAVAATDLHRSHRSVDQDSAVDSPAVDHPVDTHRAVAADTHPVDTEATLVVAVDTLPVVMEAAVVAADTNKSRSVTQPMKALTSTNNCSTRSKKFCSNKRISEAVADMVVVDTLRADTEASQAAMEHHQAQAMAHQAPAMVHLDTAQDASLPLNSDMPFRDTKSLST